METTQDMLKALLDDNINIFRSSFDDSIKNMVDDKLQDKQIEISQDILGDIDINNDTNESVVVEGYGRVGLDEYRFENNIDARGLVQSALKAGIPKKSLTVKENSVHVKDLADSDMEELLYFIAKDMGAIMNESRNIINTLQEVVIGENNINFIFENGDYKTITLTEARNIIKIHDKLIRDNQIKMRHQLAESSESFNRMSDFSKRALHKVG